MKCSGVLQPDMIKTACVKARSMSGITLRRGTLVVKNWGGAVEREGHTGT